ncbi:MAG: ABC transporter permease [Betaproteobacteria bacterium]|nr:ABC transporter permease [Betaproteobacteria bacterium]
MLRLIAKRLIAAVPSLFGVVVITFILTRALPGDPAAYFAGGAATAEAIEQVRRQLGLDRSLAEQFLRYLGDLGRGELGLSLTTGQPVLTEIAQRLPASLEIVLVALLVACAIAVPLGVLAAVKQGSWIDQVCRVITTAGVSLPTFFTGLLLAYFFYYLLGWAPSPMGRLDPMFSAPPTVTGFLLIDSLIAREGAVWWAAMKQLSLPVATMAIFVLAPIARMTRASMLGVLGSDFIRTARASGLTPITVLFAYALRNALLPVITTLGMVFGFMLGGSVIVEKVFGWPGIGSYAIDALTASDYAPVQGFVLTMGVLFVFVNLLVDLLYLVVDPRVSVDA